MDENGSDIIELTDEANGPDAPRPVKDSPWKDRRGLICSCFLSALLHLAVYSTLAYVAVSYPVIAASSDQEVLWFYPSLLFGTIPTTAGDEHALPTDKPSRPSGEKAVSSPTDPHPAARQPVESIPVPILTGKPDQPAVAGEMELRSAPPRLVVAESPRHASRAVAPALVPPRTQSKHDHKPDNTTVEVRKTPPVPPEQFNPNEQSQKPPAPSVQATAPETATHTHVAESERGTPPPQTRDSAGTTSIEMKHETPGPSPSASPEPPRIAEKVSSAVTTPQNIVKREPPPVGPVVKNDAKRARPESPSSLTPSPQTKDERSPFAAPAILPKQEEKPRQRIASATFLKQEAGPKPGAVPPFREASAPSAGDGSSPIAPAATSVELSPPAAQRKGKEKGSSSDAAATAAKGLLAPPLIGELTFELVSPLMVQRGVKVAVLFRDFPKSKRDRPIPKAEARRMIPLDPKVMVVAGKNTLRVVVDKVGEGICYLRVEHEHPTPVELSIVVRLYEGAPRARTKHLPIRMTRNNETILKVLMPEGILWEDSDAFTGSLENSDSMTRFNTDTGLIWKEYN